MPFKSAEFVAKGAGSQRLEDRIVARRDNESLLFFGVADGAGGMGGGAEASDISLSEFQSQLPPGVSWEDVPYGTEAFWIRLLEIIDSVVEHDPESGEAALVVGVATSNSEGHGMLFGASAGDCSAWLISDFDYIELTEHQKKRPFLGSGEASACAFEATIIEGETLIVATDGLFKYAPVDSILEICRKRSLRLSLLPEALVDLARLPNGDLPDDCAVIALRLQPSKSKVSWYDSK